MKYRLFFVILICLISLNNTGCKKSPTEPDGNITLAVEDASCTEAWLTLKADGIAGAEVYRGDSLIFNFAGQSIDTTIYDEGLLPNKSYNYNLTIRELNNKTLTRSAAVQTMDTTSHNFTWQTFTFGQHSSSTLYDVAIIDENNIWAVGEIYMNDSLGNPDPNAYNAVHWDGRKWEVKRIMFYIDQDQPNNGTMSSPCQSAFLFEDNALAITSNVQTYILNPNGSSKIIKMGFEWKDRFTINKLWGTSSSDLYAVGNGGNIAHYNGSNWTKIESGTTLNIYDIWGDFNKRTQEWEILAVASHLMHGDGNKILEINGTTAKAASNYPINSYDLEAVWFIPGRHYYVGGDGLYEKSSLTDSMWRNHPRDISMYSKTGINGNGLNDLFVVGAYGEVLHFNGTTWKSFINEGTGINGAYGHIAMKNDFVAIIGFVGIQAIITIGERK